MPADAAPGHHTPTPDWDDSAVGSSSRRSAAPEAFDRFQADAPEATGERLDAHRKRQQAAHRGLTLTQMYNVLEKLRAGEPIEGRDREIYDDGLVGILRQLHDAIDAETARAYGWPAGLADDAILHRLVALNRERAAEEAQGLVRWLRPAFQNPDGRAAAPAATPELDLGEAAAAAAREARLAPPRCPSRWPPCARRCSTPARPSPPTSPAASAAPAPTSVAPLLETLAALGHARRDRRRPLRRLSGVNPSPPAPAHVPAPCMRCT